MYELLKQRQEVKGHFWNETVDLLHSNNIFLIKLGFKGGYERDMEL